jgi:hypothetical protein
MRKALVLFLAMVFGIGSQTSSRQIESGIVQVKLNRIYFDTGLEDGVKPGSPFIIKCDGEEIIAGTIEYSGPGISFSLPLLELDSLNLQPDCMARVTTPGIDSSAVITIGTDIPMKFFDPEHETLFTRRADTVMPNLVDSSTSIGNTLVLYLKPGLRCSDGTPFNSDVVSFFLEDLRNRSHSYLCRYFFSKLLPVDTNGIEMTDAHIITLHFYRPFPRAAYFLSHPDFAVYNRSGRGTGSLKESFDPAVGSKGRVFVPNVHYRGERSAFAKIIIRHFQQQYRLKFSYENGKIDGYIGFGYEADLAGIYESRALYPEIAVMTAGIGGELFSQAVFPTSLYYCFNPSLAHIYFQLGDIVEINRWLQSTASISSGERYYTYNCIAGNRLQSSIRSSSKTALMVYDQSILYETARYFADIIARRDMTAPIKRHTADSKSDIRLTFFPASDEIMPFALIAAVLELNDQNSFLPADRRLDRPGWGDTDRGSRLHEIRNRNNFFARAEETIIQEGGFFPLFRPYIYAVSKANIKDLGFDFYGYPVVEKVVKLTEAIESIDQGSEQ